MKERVIEWLFNGEVGISSKTIAASVLRVDYKSGDIPYDKYDFGRCYKLVKSADIPMTELQILAKRYPKWKPVIDNWDKLVYRYKNNIQFYDYLQTLIK